MTTQLDDHVFGLSDYLDASDYIDKGKITARCKDFLGRREFIKRDGTTARAGFYKMEYDNKQKEFKLGIKNEKLLYQKFGIKTYEQLIGKSLTLEIKKYALGYGFVVIGVV